MGDVRRDRRRNVIPLQPGRHRTHANISAATMARSETLTISPARQHGDGQHRSPRESPICRSSHRARSNPYSELKSPVTDDQLRFTKGDNSVLPAARGSPIAVPGHRIRPRTGHDRSTNRSSIMPLNEYEPGTAFPGVIGRTTDESSPAWPRPLRAAAGAPNVLFIVLDDVGYGQLGCYGSPIATPNLDALAAGGLLYTNMHTTALCSPSRSCIITGRNHHANATAAINELATGYPGYNGSIPFENGFLSGDAAAARLQHLHGRQVPPDALGIRVGGGAVRPLAARARLRALLRVPGRGHQPVVPGAGLRQPPGRAAPHPRSRAIT